jgi:hypothetical protein
MQSQAFFSTTFFAFGDDGWKSSDQLWLYWVITIVSTILVLVVWSLWLRGKIQPLFAPHAWKRLLERVSPEKSKENGAGV